MSDSQWKPPPQGVAGLNSIMVYGENLQVAVGINHQLALGSNFQICINPAGLAAGVPGYPAPAPVTGLLGGGLGGNMQFTIGTSANFVVGRSLDINLGPPRITVDDGKSHIGSFILCGIIGALAVVWTILYAKLGDDARQKDYDRATEALIFQGLFDLALSILVMMEMNYKKVALEADIAQKETLYDAVLKKTPPAPDAEVSKAGDALVGAKEELAKTFGMGGIGEFCEAMGAASAILGAIVLPLIGIAGEESSKFDKE
jgi:hypothetical protein